MPIYRVTRTERKFTELEADNPIDAVNKLKDLESTGWHLGKTKPSWSWPSHLTWEVEDGKGW